MKKPIFYLSLVFIGLILLPYILLANCGTRASPGFSLSLSITGRLESIRLHLQLVYHPPFDFKRNLPFSFVAITAERADQIALHQESLFQLT